MQGVSSAQAPAPAPAGRSLAVSFKPPNLTRKLLQIEIMQLKGGYKCTPEVFLMKRKLFCLSDYNYNFTT